MDAKKYEGKVYIGVVESEIENGDCRDSIDQMIRRPDDTLRFARGTKGYESRQTHINVFLETDMDFLLLLDGDMKFPEDALERLRSHGLPYVSGLYMRRRFNPMAPVWYENGEPGVMPMKVWTRVMEPNKLYEIGASGWGCVLVHRDVIMGVRALLKGEPEVIEDDMDVYPYDLEKVLRGEEQIRPLRVKKDMVGSDIRFPFYAKLAGFQMYGDSGVQCGHWLNYHLQPADFIQDATTNPDIYRQVTEHVENEVTSERTWIEEKVKSMEAAHG